MGLDRAVLFRLATSERLERVVEDVPYGGDWFRYFMRRLADSRGA